MSTSGWHHTTEYGVAGDGITWEGRISDILPVEFKQDAFALADLLAGAGHDVIPVRRIRSSNGRSSIRSAWRPLRVELCDTCGSTERDSNGWCAECGAEWP